MERAARTAIRIVREGIPVRHILSRLQAAPPGLQLALGAVALVVGYTCAILVSPTPAFFSVSFDIFRIS